MTGEAGQLKKPEFWMFLNRLLWLWALLAWGFIAILTVLKRPTWLPPVSLASRLWFAATALAGAAYLLAFPDKWHRMFGMLANLMLAVALAKALIEDFGRHPVLNSLVGLPIVLLLGIPTFLLARGVGPPTPVPTP